MTTAPPLSDVRVLEMGQLLAGPFCGQLLADFGAEVIKIEDPGRGDAMRQWGRDTAGGASLWWPIVARNKKSVTVDLRTPEGRDVVAQLVGTCDVVLENFRPGQMERWELSYEALSAINPRLVMIRVSGFGQDGPYAARAGYGSIGEAMGGLRYITGDPERPPSRVGISIGDALAAMFATIGGLIALRERDISGRGQVVDSAIYEAVLALMESLLPEFELAGYVRERTGAILPNVAPSNAYATADDQMILIAGNQDTVFTRLAKAMGQPELATDPRYVDHVSRGANQVELDQLIAQWTAAHDADHVLELLHEAGVPAGRVFTAADMLADPHFAARNAITRLVHPELGEFPMQNVVPRLSRTPGSVRALGPELGEHTDEVLGELLGLSDEERAALRRVGAI